MADTAQGPQHPREAQAEGEGEGDGETGAEGRAGGGERFSELPPRIRLKDTIASQETPPKPEVIGTPDDPHRADLRYPG